jgi:hypothetical protein
MLALCIGNDDMAAVKAAMIGGQRAKRGGVDRSRVGESRRRGVENDRDGNEISAP